MMQMNLVTKQKDTHRLRERTYGCQGKRIVREIEMDMYILLYSKWITTRPCCIAQGTLFNVMWQPGREGSLEEKRYPYVYG